MANKNLLPQTDKNLVPTEQQSILHFKGKWAMIVTGAGTAFSWFSTFLHWGTIILDWLQRADFLNTKFIELLRWFFSPRGAQFFTGVFLIAFLIAVYRTVHPKERSQQETSEIDEATTKSKSDEEQPESMNDLIRSAARDLKEVPCGEGWLHAIAENDRLEIQSAVVVSNINFYNYTDDIHFPYVEFVFTIFNMSVYEVSIDDAIEGYITLNRQKLKKDNLELEKNNAQNCHVRGTGNFTLRQYLNDVDLRLVMESSEDREFWFNNLIITIKGGENSPQVESKQLNMIGQVSKKYPTWNNYGLPNKISTDIPTDLIAEIDSLKAQLEELNKHKLKFEIDVSRSKVNVSALDNETYYVSMELRIRFINSDTHPLFVNKINVSLISKNEEGTELEIPKIDQLLTEMTYDPNLNNPVKLKSWDNIDLKISERDKTPYHTVSGSIRISRDYRKIFDSCFLRVIMEAMNQSSYPLNFDVDWENINQGWMNITFRS